MFSKQKTKITYVIIALICLVALLYLFKPKSEFETCYNKCLSSYPNKCYLSSFDKTFNEIKPEGQPSRSDCINIKGYCVNICSRLK